MNTHKYRVDGKFFRTVSEARREQRAIKAGLPSDAVVTIYRREECAPTRQDGSHDFMWVPHE